VKRELFGVGPTHLRLCLAQVWLGLTCRTNLGVLGVLWSVGGARRVVAPQQGLVSWAHDMPFVAYFPSRHCGGRICQVSHPGLSRRVTTTELRLVRLPGFDSVCNSAVLGGGGAG
jgi:hypothetical protein